MKLTDCWWRPAETAKSYLLNIWTIRGARTKCGTMTGDFTKSCEGESGAFLINAMAHSGYPHFIRWLFRTKIKDRVIGSFSDKTFLVSDEVNVLLAEKKMCSLRNTQTKQRPQYSEPKQKKLMLTICLKHL